MSFVRFDGDGPRFDVFGPVVQFLVGPDDQSQECCILLGSMQPGITVPLHSHPEPEFLFVQSGQVDVLHEKSSEPQWTRFGPGESAHITAGTRHALRNQGAEAVWMLLVTSKKMGRFFLDIGRPAETAAPPTSAELVRFEEICRQYGFSNASPQENAAVGIQLGP